MKTAMPNHAVAPRFHMLPSWYQKPSTLPLCSQASWVILSLHIVDITVHTADATAIPKPSPHTSLSNRRDLTYDEFGCSLNFNWLQSSPYLLRTMP
eukprot:5391871-Pleurochrysis_carterae.AAC.1